MLDIKTHKSICIAERWGDIDPTDKDAVADKIRRQNRIVPWWADIMRQLSKPEVKIHQFSPYEGAAAEIAELEHTRRETEEIVVDRSALNRKIIRLSDELDKKARLEADKSKRIIKEG